MKYTVPFVDVATGAVADTFKTLAALLNPNTLGARVRLRSLEIGPSDDTPQDVNVAIQIKRIESVSGGTAGVAASTVPTTQQGIKKDDQSLDPVTTGPRDYSTEPTVYATEPLWQDDFNAHGGYFKEWDEEDGPVILKDQLLGVLAAPRSASAVRLSGTLEYEMF